MSPTILNCGSDAAEEQVIARADFNTSRLIERARGHKLQFARAGNQPFVHQLTMRIIPPSSGPRPFRPIVDCV